MVEVTGGWYTFLSDMIADQFSDVYDMYKMVLTRVQVTSYTMLLYNENQ